VHRMKRAIAAIAALSAAALVATGSASAEPRIHVTTEGAANVFVHTTVCPGFATVERIVGFPELGVGVFIPSEWSGVGYTDGNPAFEWVFMKTRIWGSGSDPNTGAEYTMKGKLEGGLGPGDVLGVGDVRIKRDDGMTLSGTAYFNVLGPGRPEIIFTEVTACG
jgi:hypothetical protein